MDPLKHLGSIQDMLDRADPGRKIREQQDAIRKSLEAANPGRELLEQHDTIRKAMEAANPGRKLLGQQEAVRDAFDASSLISQYEQKLAPPSELFGTSVPTAELGREMLGSVTAMADNARRQLEVSLYHLSRGIAHQEIQLHSALSASLVGLRDIHTDGKLIEWTHSIARAAKGFSAAYESFVGQGFHGLANVMSERNEWLDRIQAASSPVLGMLAQELAGGLTTGLSPAMVEGFGSELSTHIWQVSKSDTAEETQEILEVFTAWLLRLLSRLPNTRLSREAALSIFLTLVSMFYSQISSHRTERRIAGKIEASRSAVEQRFEELEATVRELKSEPGDQDHYEDSRFCIVVTNLRLRSGPGTEFEVLRVLPSNLSVRVAESTDGWALVEFFDFVEGKMVEGWVADEYLLDWAEWKCDARDEPRNTKLHRTTSALRAPAAR